MTSAQHDPQCTLALPVVRRRTSCSRIVFTQSPSPDATSSCATNLCDSSTALAPPKRSDDHDLTGGGGGRLAVGGGSGENRGGMLGDELGGDEASGLPVMSLSLLPTLSTLPCRPRDRRRLRILRADCCGK